MSLCAWLQKRICPRCVLGAAVPPILSRIYIRDPTTESTFRRALRTTARTYKKVTSARRRRGPRGTPGTPRGSRATVRCTCGGTGACTVGGSPNRRARSSPGTPRTAARRRRRSAFFSAQARVTTPRAPSRPRRGPSSRRRRCPASEPLVVLVREVAVAQHERGQVPALARASRPAAWMCACIAPKKRCISPNDRARRCLRRSASASASAFVASSAGTSSSSPSSASLASISSSSDRFPSSSSEPSRSPSVSIRNGSNPGTSSRRTSSRRARAATLGARRDSARSRSNRWFSSSWSRRERLVILDRGGDGGRRGGGAGRRAPPSSSPRGFKGFRASDSTPCFCGTLGTRAHPAAPSRENPDADAVFSHSTRRFFGARPLEPSARKRRGAWTRRAARRCARYGGRVGGGREDGRVSDEGAGSRGPRVSPPRFLRAKIPGHAHKITKKDEVSGAALARASRREPSPRTRGDTALLGHDVASLTRRTRREAWKPAARTRAVCCASRLLCAKGHSHHSRQIFRVEAISGENRRAGRVVFA